MAPNLEEITSKSAELDSPDYQAFLESKAQAAQLAADLITNIPFCPWTPNPGPQSIFLLDFGREALYGGAAGGGKSIALLMAASMFLTVPGYSALLLRKKFSDLTKPGALMDIADQWWGPLQLAKQARFDTQENTWYFNLPHGQYSRIVFGYLDKANDKFNYQGGAYSFVGFDEVTQHKATDYTYLFSRMRRTKDPSNPISRVPVRMRSTANPGGTGHKWVFTRFIAPWQAWKEKGAEQPKRNFYPALIKDNPKLDEEDYIESLMELDPITRAQLMRGDWNIRPEARFFKKDWFKPIKAVEIPPNCTWVRYWDMASTEENPEKDQVRGGPDFTAGALVGRHPDGRIILADMRHWRHEPATNDMMCMATCLHDTSRVIQVMEQEPGSSGKPLYTGSMILMGDGSYKPLGEIQVDDEVISHNGVPCPVWGVHEQGDLPTVRITTASGRSVVAALDHPFLTPVGWVNAGDLKVGETLGLPIPVTTGISDRSMEEFRLAGYFVGDGACGWNYEGSVSTKAQITCFDLEEEEDILLCAKSLGWEWRRDRPGSLVFKKGVQPWLREIGLAGQLSGTKRVPEWVMTATNEQVAQFLGAYFACDGHVTQSPKVGRGLEFYSISPGLMQDVQHLLLRFGIMCKMKAKVGRYLGERHESWRLSILASNDGQARFAQYIPVPGVKSHTLAELPSRVAFDSSILPDRITKIEDNGLAPCRCLTVGGDHTFTAEDLIVHNTAIYHFRTQVFHGMNFRGIPSTGSKSLRAGPFASQAQAGQVYYVVDGTWDAEDFFDEAEAFPDPTVHDDRVDAVAGAYSILMKMVIGKINFGQHVNDDFIRESPWRPDVTLVLSPADLASGGGVLGKKLEEARMHESAIARNVANAWGM